MSAAAPGLEALYTAEEMRAAEAAYAGRTIELMERAGRRVAEEALGRFPDARRVAVWCGTGANGGDGLVVARELARARRDCVVRLLGAEEKVTGDAAVNLARAKRDGVAFAEEPGPADLVVDALFGTGFSGAPRPEAARAIVEMNAAEVPIVAVDLPSGVDASTGTVAGPAVEASLTVTFHAPKVGHAVAPGRFHVGHLVVADIGLAEAPTRIRRATAGILDAVPRRGERDNKYSAGSVLVVGGSEGLTGAPSLSSQAALRAGAGIVTACVPASLNVVLEQRLLEVMTRPCPDEDGAMTLDAADTILAAAERAGAVALGPGLGRTDGTIALVERLLEQLEKPVVLDADGLWALTGHLEWVFSRDAPTVLTPHAGELARLLGRSSAWVSANRLDGRRDRGGRRRRRSAPQGRRHARRAAGPRADRGRPRESGARDRRERRRPHGCRRSLPGEGDGRRRRSRGGIRRLRRRVRPGRRAPRRRRDDRERRRRSPLAGALEVRRSEITIDLGALRRNADRVRAAVDARRALGRRQGGRLRPRRRRRRRRRAPGRGRRALRRDRAGGRRAPRAGSRTRGSWS